MLFLFLIVYFSKCDFFYEMPLTLSFNFDVTEEVDFTITINTKELIDNGLMALNCSCKDVSFVLSGDEDFVIPYYLETGCYTQNTIYWLRYNETIFSRGVELSGSSDVNELTFLFSDSYYEHELNSGRYDVNMRWYLPYLGTSGGCVAPYSTELSIVYNGNNPVRFFRIGRGSEILGSVEHGHDVFGKCKVQDSDFQDVELIDAGYTLARRNHTHDISFSLQPEDNLPPAFNIGVCVTETNYFELISKQIVFSTNLSVQEITTQYSNFWGELDDDYYDKFLRFVTFEEGESGEDENNFETFHNGIHSHIFVSDEFEVSDVWDSFVEFVDSGTYYEGVNVHDHDLEGTENALVNEIPLMPSSYREIVAVGSSLSYPKPFPQFTLLARYSSTDGIFEPPIGWIDQTDEYDGNFLFVVSEIQQIGTITPPSHTHNATGELGSPQNAEVESIHWDYDQPNQISIEDHNHDFNVQSQPAESSNPLNLPLLLLTRKNDPSESLLSSIFANTSSISSRIWGCYGVLNIKKDEVCGGNGGCFSENYCICDENYYGTTCQKRIERGSYTSLVNIQIPYDILVSVLINHPNSEDFLNDIFNCSIIINEDSLKRLNEKEEDSSSSTEEEEEQPLQCSWISESIIRTSYLRIQNVKNPNVNYLDIYVLSDETAVEEEMISVNISAYTTPINLASDDGVPLGSVALVFGIVFSPLILFLVLVCVISCCVFCLFLCIFAFLIYFLQQMKGKLNRFKEIDDIDLLLKEQEEMNKRGSAASLAKIKIDKSLFEVNFDEITVVEKIGEGGSNSFVFKAMWRSRPIAFKCYKTQDLCSDQSTFNEFENEVKILASVHHPCILAFYGASLLPPRIGILMEFCARGDLKAFLISYKKEQKKCFEKTEKLRILIEIASAVLYLHTKSIIHRDLKLENVLMTDNLNSKLMDFGLSKMLREKQIQKNNMTKAIGTSYYMAPEVTLGEKYDEKCDVFSFGVLIYVIMTETFENPYGNEKGLFNIEMKVANEPTFRPPLSGEEIKKQFQWKGMKNPNSFRSLMKNCWEHKSENRPTFNEVMKRLIEIRNEEKDEKDDQQPFKEEDDREEWEENEQQQQQQEETLIENLRKEIENLKKENGEMKREIDLIQS